MGFYKHRWLYLSKGDLETERLQAQDEGKDITALTAVFDRLIASDLENDQTLQREAEALLDKTAVLPIRKDYPYDEPSDLAGIRARRPARKPLKPDAALQPTQAANPPAIPEAVLRDKMLGAWQGRCAGCLLGKPVEGWRSPRMWGYLKDQNKFPLADYFRSDVPPAIAETYLKGARSSFIDQVDHMPEDDDTNYTVAGFVLMKRKGRDFSSEDVADLWLGDIPLLHTCTAERVAYRNLSNLVPPPASALMRNPYREWIGAQIRADFFGYAAPGNPELAAEYAFRDAAISHVKNGIYGEMFVAAMLAAAALEGADGGTLGGTGAGAAGAKSGGAQETEAALRRIIDAGLGEIPAACRLAEDVEKVIGWRGQGLGYDQAIGRIHAQWDENIGHHWTHTNSNAQIVVLGLLWAEGDFEKAICRAVEACFDTDCNGATVGSIMGMLLGAQALPRKWIAPLNDTLDTGIAGYNRVSISALAKESFELFGRDISPRA